MRLLDDLHVQRTRSFDGSVEVVHLEPEQDSMSNRRRVRVDEIWVIVVIPRMELEDQMTITKHRIIANAMFMLGERLESEQRFVPATACPDIPDGNQRLGLNARFSQHGFPHFLSHRLFYVYSILACGARRSGLSRRFNGPRPFPPLRPRVAESSRERAPNDLRLACDHRQINSRSSVRCPAMLLPILHGVDREPESP